MGEAHAIDGSAGQQGRRNPLTLVSTPAGYGKSTLLSRWLAASGSRTAWVSLDEDHGDQRERLERTCRYALRLPVAQERLHLAGA